jgi:LytS/YehU family sensor histidine kinase
VPDALANVQVPSLILQPLVENAIKHGVARSGQPVTVTIRARREGASLHLSVEDDARETDGPAPGNGTGVGLTNVRQRLVARFDGAAHVAAGPRGGGGFKVEMIMPLSVDPGGASG